MNKLIKRTLQKVNHLANVINDILFLLLKYMIYKLYYFMKGNKNSYKINEPLKKGAKTSKKKISPT